jgi:hypothetical protein
MAVLPAQVGESAEAQANEGGDRRRAPRFKRNSKAQLIFWPASPRTAPIDVQLVDYSRTGVGVVNHEAIIVGQKFVLREPFVTHGSTCIYTVVRCSKCDDGHYIIGLHATPSEEPTLATEPVPGISKWLRIGYFVFAVIGAIAIVAMAMFDH